MIASSEPAAPPRQTAIPGSLRGWPRLWRWPWRASTFEKVIAANSVVIILATIAGWWITQHNPETYHYLIDTSFIALAATLGLAVNFLALRAAFAPLRDLLTTMRAVEQGDLEARVRARESDRDVLTIARTFNAMLDRLAHARDDAAARVLHAQEDERRRVALELHDQTGQSLTALTLHAEAIAQRLADECSPAATQARHQAERLAGLAQQTLAEVQALARQLRPPMLDDLGLEAALRWLAEDACERLGVVVWVRARGLEDEGKDAGMACGDAATALYRIAQESVTNAVRHGHALHIAIGLLATPIEVRLTVADDGRGFASDNRLLPYAVPHLAGGMGLEGMRSRIRLLGGSLTIRSRPGRGCAVRAVLPPAPLAVPLISNQVERGYE